MPCPAGVNIPLNFEIYNNKYLNGNEEEAKFYYAVRLSGSLTAGETEFASKCIQCGQCVEQCPQQIDIPTVLESVVEELEGSDIEQRVAFAQELFKK